jgi:hypothetical protein
VVAAVARVLADPTVVEVDCNPVVVRRGQPVVLDALVVTEDLDEPIDAAEAER